MPSQGSWIDVSQQAELDAPPLLLLRAAFDQWCTTVRILKLNQCCSCFYFFLPHDFCFCKNVTLNKRPASHSPNNSLFTNVSHRSRRITIKSEKYCETIPIAMYQIPSTCAVCRLYMKMNWQRDKIGVKMQKNKTA